MREMMQIAGDALKPTEKTAVEAQSKSKAIDPTRRKPVQRAAIPLDQRLLVDRRNAALYLSISQRSLDYLVANGELNVRRIGSRVLIPISELQRYARTDHERLVG